MLCSGWVRVTIDCSAEKAESILEVMDNAGADSTSLLLAEKGRYQVSAIFDELNDDGSELHQVLNSMRGNDANFCIKQDFLPDRDWVIETQREFQPLQIRDKLWITAPWHDIQVGSATNVVIKPAMSFGTGHHPTTQMCLEFLCDLDQKDYTVLDYGCGSGILAISALALGAKRAVGIDNDPVAVTESIENAKRNGVAKRYLTTLPGKDQASLCVDVVVANLFSKVLIELAGKLIQHTRLGGWIVVSGILSDQVAATRRAFGPMVNHSVRVEGEWASIIMRRIA